MPIMSLDGGSDMTLSRTSSVTMTHKPGEHYCYSSVLSERWPSAIGAKDWNRR